MAPRQRPAGEELQAFLRREIPLSRRMAVEVASLDAQALELRAPLAPNVNHKRTAFGGSLYSLATLAAWGMVRQILVEAGLEAHVVIQEGALTYHKPVTGDFHARCDRPSGGDAERFRQAFARKGKARMALKCEVRDDSAGASGGPAAVFQGLFVATRAKAPAPASPNPASASGRAKRRPLRGKG